jgi:hypothetical protein
MPTIEAREYERFSYDDPLTLDEAVKKASELRRRDSANFYRVENVDEGRNAFTVKKVPVASVYADFIASVFKLQAYLRRWVAIRPAQFRDERPAGSSTGNPRNPGHPGAAGISISSPGD